MTTWRPVEPGEVRIDGDPPHSFTWRCPDCGHAFGGRIGDEAVSGWDNPQWVLTGTPDAPTLTPSLGCGGFGRGECTGHFWLRDGELVRA